ncbi:thermonuclease family protein [Hydrogenophaga crocea]|uniref:Thermonuclease family protein n=1 Tax=Hydrogenophaga crocea TaxID=2716225 RepID=A0A6G8IND5_9BURK|nr:thermonuclease family protein [Hydrogenophaga crocea]QIM54518.1 thermonuclease family protein [Hydrogenophaga crocea]
MRASAWVLAALLAGCAPLAARADGPERYDARVVRVFDGDTLWVQPADGGRWRKLRLDDIDAPEICQAGGLAARDALAERVLGRTVQVEQRAHDAYGRAIVRLQLQGEDLNRWLVRTGHAWAHQWRGSGPYLSEEAAARRAARGLFGHADPEPPRDFRRRHGACENPPNGLSVPR